MNTHASATRLWIAILGIALSSMSYSDTWRLRDGTSICGVVAGYDKHRMILNQHGRYIEVPFERLAAGSREAARRALDEESTATAPETQVLASSPTTPGHGLKRLVSTTAYSHHEADHQPYGARSAMGTRLQFDGEYRSAAADWSVYPAGTIFRITGHPWTYVVDDYGSALVGTSTIDLYHPDLDSMRKWGRRNVEITILRWGSYERSARILEKRVRHTHCRAMFFGIKQRLAAH